MPRARAGTDYSDRLLGWYSPDPPPAIGSRSMARKQKRTPPPVSPQNLMTQAVQAYQQGDMARARKALLPLLEHLPPDGQVLILAGLVDLQQNRPQQAEKRLRQGVRLEPGRIEGWFGLGSALEVLGDARGAADAFKAVLERQPDQPDARYNLAVSLETIGRTDRALEEFNRLFEQRPEYPGVRHSRARCLARLGHAEQARALYAELVAAQPDDRALALEYAEFLEQNNEPAAAGEILALVEAADAGAALWPRVARLRARLHARAGEVEAALETALGARQQSEDAALAFETGRLLDRTGRFEQAVAAFEQGNRARGGQWSFQRLQRQQFAEFVADKARRGLSLPTADGAAAAADEPIFLIGLPRSGTTLLDRMLGAHPRVQLLEEFEGLRMAEDALRAGESAEVARKAWRETIEGRTNVVAGARLIDKNPLHAAHLDTLAYLFPTAPVIILRRHPFDAALSCWMQDFAPNPATVHFLERDATARLCGDLLTLMQRFEAGRPEQTVTLAYEDLVQDFRGEIARVLAGVGLEWDDAVAEYIDHTRRGGMITTPSYEQVTRGLYTSAIERWRNYAPWLDGFEQHLGSAARAWGYSTE